MAREAEWKDLSDEALVGEYRDEFSLWTTTVEAASETAAQLVLNPLPLLIEHTRLVDEGWTVSLDRTNAHIPMGPEMGPRKVLVLWVLVRAERRVHGVVHRLDPLDRA